MAARFQPVSRASSNTGLVQDLVEDELLRSSAVIAAFLAVDRALFASPQSEAGSSSKHIGTLGVYHDVPTSLGHGASLCSPASQAVAAELIQDSCENRPLPFPSCGKRNPGLIGKRVLDVGSGSGYFSVLMAKLVGPSGKVIGIEHVPELVSSATATVKRSFPELSDVVSFVVGDGRLDAAVNGDTELFDVIHVGAAVTHIPQHLLSLLRPFGRLVVPFGVEGSQFLYTIDKLADGSLKTSKEAAVAAPSLTSLDVQCG